MKLVERLKAHRDFRDVKVSPLLVVAKAVCLAMRRTPEINAAWDEAAQEVVFKRSRSTSGIAAATPRGLVVPNVKGADALSLPTSARRINDADPHRPRRQDPAGRDERRHLHDHQRRRLRRRRGHPDHQPRRVRDPVLRRGPQAAVGHDQAGARIKVRDITTLALSFDHRLIDGEKGSRFLADVAAVLEDPSSALLPVGGAQDGRRPLLRWRR